MAADAAAAAAAAVLQNIGDLLQEQKPVSYKWLAREYALPANYAKQLLFRFAQEHQGGAAAVTAVYTVSGVLKPAAAGGGGDQQEQEQHIVRLVPAAQLDACCEQLRQETITMHVHRCVGWLAVGWVQRVAAARQALPAHAATHHHCPSVHALTTTPHHTQRPAGSSSSSRGRRRGRRHATPHSGNRQACLF
jgi:hypothetical protein